MTTAPIATAGRYAVIGNPVAHSRSPRIHELFAASRGEHIDYRRVLSPLDAFVATVLQFRADDGVGANVTVPFKQEAFALASVRSPRAEHAGAVNCLAWRGDHWFGDNTDGIGLVRDLQDNLATPLAGKRVLLLGAGGAARGVLLPLLACAPARLAIINRTHARAVELAASCADDARVAALAGEQMLASGERFDVVINATSSSLGGELPVPSHARLFADGALAYDMMYGKQRTVFLQWAADQGAARLADGLGMLVEQAAESYLIWRGALPERQAVIALVRADLAAA